MTCGGQPITAQRGRRRPQVPGGQKEAISAVDITGNKSSDPFEIVQLAREHNNANILSIATRFVEEDEAKFACQLFLRTKFSGDERHIRRINKID